MKKILILGISCLCYFGAAAQISKSAVNISVGPSFPTGDFGSKNLYDNNSGLATTGAFAEISYSYQFSKFFGFIAAVKGKVHSVDKSTLASYSVPEGVGASLSISATPWRAGNIMAGAFQSIPITSDEKFVFEIKEMAGVQFTKSPAIKVSVVVPNMGSFTSNEEAQNATSFAYTFGLGFKYNINKTIGLRLYGDYNGTRPTFTFTSYPADAPEQQEFKQNINTFDLGLGIAIGL